MKTEASRPPFLFVAMLARGKIQDTYLDIVDLLGALTMSETAQKKRSGTILSG